ncbi:MAG: type I methionyl aminopeptidase [Chloroflexota bacterium]
MASITYKTADEIEIMRQAGRIVAEAHAAMAEAVAPGVTTKELDTIAETVIRDYGAIPAFLDYGPGGKPPFPATITASINEELVHGIPSDERVLQEGDIISLDTACFHQGYVGDAAYTYAVGEIGAGIRRLLESCEAALYAAIDASVVGNKVSDVARATQKYAASKGYSVAMEYTGHGVGQAMHEPPQVPNWWPRKKPRPGQPFWMDYPLKPGMTFAIEPMLIAGRNELYELDDKWTVVTKDGSLCAHFEHTVHITESGAEILTLLPE